MSLADIKARVAVEQQLRKRAKDSLGQGDFMEFVPAISPRYEAPRHLKPLVDELMKVFEGPHFVIVSVPPRHHKTETLLHFIAYYLKRRSHHNVAYSTYAQDLSESKAVKAQQYAREAGVEAHPLMANRKDWQTRENGGLFATSIGGEFTGRGANLLIVDDPFANREQAESTTYRNKVWAWWEDVGETRLEPGASVVVLMTRWHADDFSGRLIINRPEFKVIRIPALADGLDEDCKLPAPDPVGRQIGEALLPDKFPAHKLEKFKREKPFTFTSLYQGAPRPRESRVLQDPVFYTTLPTTYKIYLGADLAYSKKRKADRSVFIAYYSSGDLYYVRDVKAWRADITVTKTKLEALQQHYNNMRIGLEANGPQKAVCDTLESAPNSVRVRRIIRSSDKYSEGLSFIEAWNEGRVLIPENAPWRDQYVEQMMAFTGVDDAEDDYFDASVNGFPRRSGVVGVPALPSRLEVNSI